ncbi:hypothetical protein ACFL04_01015 [Patescibacteria group bacterium]
MSEKWTHFVDKDENVGTDGGVAVLEVSDEVRSDPEVTGIFFSGEPEHGVELIEGDCAPGDVDVDELITRLMPHEDEMLELNYGDPIQLTGTLLGIVQYDRIGPDWSAIEYPDNRFLHLRLTDGTEALVPITFIDPDTLRVVI